MALQPDNAQVEHDLSLALENLGGLASPRSAIPKRRARRRRKASRSVAGSSREAPSDNMRQRDLSVGLTKIGDTDYYAGDMAGGAWRPIRKR